MSLVALRRRSAPLSIATLCAFLFSLAPVRRAWAEDDAPTPPPAAEHSATTVDESAPATTKTEPPKVASEVSEASRTGTEPTVTAHANTTNTSELAANGPAIPPHVEPGAAGGGSKTGVSSEAIALPQGAGKVQGMGESFSTQMSTGVAGLNIPITLPAARGAAQPSLGLSYSSASGHGVAGVGWDLGTAYIARQTDRGIPQYNDPPTGGPWAPTQDRFVFNGGQELVPICLVSGTSCSGALSGETMPAWSSGWQYFRPRVEGSYLRFYWSPNHQTWRVQSKSGTTMELGVPLAAPPDYGSATGGLETDPSGAMIFRWDVAREYDAYGSANPSGGGAPAPVNVVVYRYMQDGGMAYLTDVFDTPPASSAASAPLASYAHHVRLSYEARSDATTSYRRGWQVTQGQRLLGVDVTSANFGATGAPELLRRYHLAYDPSYHVSLLTSVQQEGRCAQPIPEDATGSLPASTGCPTLPATTFGYQHVAPYDTAGNPSTADIPGWEGFDERVHAMASSPNHSLDETLTDLFDMNADGLPDVIVTAPFLYNGNDAVFFNGAGGAADSFGAFQCLTVQGVPGEDTNVVRLDNPNVSALDYVGTGVIGLVNMPMVKTYSVYTPQAPTGGASCWAWQGKQITTASQQNPLLNFSGNNPDIEVMDVNGDGLVDVVFSSGTEYQTFFSLGRYPQGDGQFGSATWTSASTAAISNDPVTSCLPWDATPALLSDPDVFLADMNGDGLPDVVRVRPGDVRYWPGRGNGYWGTGDPSSCPANTYGQAQNVVMTASPQIGVIDSTESLLVDDVNGDGLNDIVKVEFESVYIWLNVDGTTWAGPHIIQNAPARAPAVNRMRLVDINGSGTRDILYGDGSAYKYMDVNGGNRPWVLTHVANGLGKTTDVQYGSSTQFMLADAAAGNPWTSVSPLPVHVVTQITESDNLGSVGRPAGVYVTQYAYHDAVFDGLQREFRGFESATATRVGDANSPSSVATSTFLLGQCLNDENESPDPCTEEGRWEDNPREALKGLPLISETSDGAGDYLATHHHTYTLRKLYTGLDGREVRYAFESQSDSYVYDTGPFTPGPQAVALTDVLLETTLGSPQTDTTESVTLRSTTGRAHIQQSSTVDPFGNVTASTDGGCVDGCATTDEVITTTTVPQLPTGDPTGWMYRTVESYVTGTQTTGLRAHTKTTYDLGGNPLGTTAELLGSLLLDRFHASGAETANNLAPNASADGWISVSAQQYTPLGQLAQQTGANHRCRRMVYDASFGQLPIQQQAFVGAGEDDCTGTPLSTVAQYDRGLGLMNQMIDVRGELTTVAYDGFGRLQQINKPDPQTPTIVSPVPSLLVTFCLPGDPSPCAVPAGAPYSLVHTQTQNGPDTNTAQYQDTWAFTDGLGRTLAVLGQGDTAGQWIVGGMSDHDAKGAARRAFLPWFWNGTPSQFPLALPSSPSGSQRYDAFGRALQTFGLDGAITLQSVYHALSVDHWDAADISPGPHQGTPASTLSDGHGRTIAVTERVHAEGGIEAHDTRTTYLSTGEPSVVTRVLVGGASAPVVRSMQYDSLGRMVLNVEPNTTTAAHAWRYAYDDSGDLVGTSDARGCGADYYYDVGGRILAEDFSPCVATQPDYSPPELNGGFPDGYGTEAFYQYDALDSDTANIPGFAIDPSLLLGRLVFVADRGAKSASRYDGRGRVTGVARRVAAPGTPDPSPTTRFAPHWYTRTVAFDGADRPVVASTGADVGALLDPNGQSVVTTTYSPRGTIGSVSSGYGDLVTAIGRAADGLVQSIVYGDAAGTQTAMSYDTRRRLSSVQTYRGPPAVWSNPGYDGTPGSPLPTFQLLLEDLDYVYDAVDNPTEIRDYRNPAEWPAGAQPVTRKLQYDDLYRVTSVAYAYPAGSDPWVSPFQAEDTGVDPDPRRAQPSPHVQFPQRVMSQSYQYDWLGNMTRTDDDAHGFYDRSLGTIANGTAAQGPYQLQSAQGTGTSYGGGLTATYDDAGNLAGMSVTRAGPCLPAGASCSQVFAYDWDEVGRLARARRWDGGDPTTGTPDAELDYAYDFSNGRVLKVATDSATGATVSTAYVFGSLELQRAGWDGSDYTRDQTTEVAYLDGGGMRLAQLHYALNSEPSLTSGHLHVLMQLPDHLGSSAIVFDHDTSELVERTTYTAYGDTESDYRPARWASFRDDSKFSGKEDDVEVGLLYFGERYYVPSLGRWASPDPLAVHGLGADLNVYTYVHGAVLRATDPVGLADMAADNPPPVSVDHPTATFSAAPALNAASVPEGAGPIGSPGNPLDLDAVRAPKATPTPAATASTGPFEGPNVQGPSVDLPSAGSYEYGAKYPRQSLDDDVPAYQNPIAQDEANRGNWRGAEILERGEPCNYCHSVVVNGYGNEDISVRTRSPEMEDAVAEATVIFVTTGAGSVIRVALESGLQRGLAQGLAKFGGSPGEDAPVGGTYKLRDPETMQVRRTGRTNNLLRRENEHLRAPETKDLTFEVDRRTDSYAAQRGREQRIWEQHPEADLNREQPIDPNHPLRAWYLREGDKL